MENNKKLRQKEKEETECLSNVLKLKEEVGNLDVESLIKEKSEINEKIRVLSEEVIVSCVFLFFALIFNFHDIVLFFRKINLLEENKNLIIL